MYVFLQLCQDRKLINSLNLLFLLHAKYPNFRQSWLVHFVFSKEIDFFGRPFGRPSEILVSKERNFQKDGGFVG